MKSWKWIAAGAGGSILLPVIWLLWMPGLLAALGTVIWSVAATLFAVRMVLREQERSMAEQQRMSEEQLKERAVQALNHHRHDWMNELQIMYGYIQLGKHDKSVQCVERIKERMLQESKVSKLGIPSLVFYFQAYRTFNVPLQLEIEVVDQLHLNEKLSPLRQEALTEVIIAAVDIYEKAGEGGSPEEERQLIITFWDQEDHCIAELEGEGAFGDRRALEQQLKRVTEHTELRVEQVDTDHMTYRLYIPYVT
ncbi:Spo0B domain-containing protein [Paenibacillus sp. JSM ZJ436]|uniref:SpoOB alpha-helical domain-containing protein n=1 Tax=Paenibacillus algicola TaxID=2565926 RepID=A0A4P8XI49_9BACL|nr:Spo0B domain-containing protein [Paenibacillus algicola]QCT01988.1 hypothetical protein E6C60_1270 [Paenibacillus algicola]